MVNGRHCQAILERPRRLTRREGSICFDAFMTFALLAGTLGITDRRVLNWTSRQQTSNVHYSDRRARVTK
jgi:hypothetical protein